MIQTLPMRLAALTASAFVLARPAWAAAAGPTCVVLDPTGTPLNVRAEPNGAILGALHNGTYVAVMDNFKDARGRLWTFVEPSPQGKAGWVFNAFLSCD